MNVFQFPEPASRTWASGDVAVARRTFAPSRVHILHPNISLVETIAVYLKIEGFDVEFSRDWAELRERYQVTRPHLLILPMYVGEQQSLGLLRDELPRGAIVDVVLVAENPTTREVVTAMQSGASDVLGLPIDGEQLLRAARRSVAQNAVVGSPSGAPKLRLAGGEELSPRERDVLNLLMDGFGSKQIAQVLGIAPRTVEGHRSHILRKMNVRNNSDLMRKIFSA